MSDFERLILDEIRDLREVVNDLRADVAALKAAEPPSRGISKRAVGGLTISTATVVAIITAVAQHWITK